MKKILFCLACMTTAFSMKAVDLKSGSFSGLKDLAKVQISFDFSDVVIDGQSLEEFKGNGAIDDKYDNWADFETFITRRMLAGINGESIKLKANRVFRTAECPSPVKLVVKPQVLCGSGEYSIDFVLVDIATGEVLGIATEDGDGGTFGSFSNLMGDGFEECGEEFAKFLVKKLK